MFKNVFFIILIIPSLFSCSRESTHHFYSPNKKHCITIKTNQDTRYIINGYHSSIPKSDYVKLDISNVDRGAGDQIVGCWNKDNFNWVIVMDKVTVLENRLDSNKYKFLNRFPLDKRGIPTLIDYIGKDCFSISLEFSEMNRIEGEIRK